MNENYHFLDMKIQEELRQRREKLHPSPSFQEKAHMEMEKFRKLLPIEEIQETENQVLSPVSTTEAKTQLPITIPPAVKQKSLSTEPERTIEESIGIKLQPSRSQPEQEAEQELAIDVEPETVSEIHETFDETTEKESIEEKERDKKVISFEDAEEEKKLTTAEINLLINQLRFSMNKKKRLKLIEQLSKYVSHPLVKSFFLRLVDTETITLARAKVISSLADMVHDEDVKNALLNALRDSSPHVRQWAVWGLMQLVEEDSDIVERLIYHLLYREGSKRVKLWILRSLNRTINQSAVEDTFLRLLSPSAPYEIRSLIVDYLLQRLNDDEICYAISRYVQKEQNKNLKKRIIKKILGSDNTDLQFALERLRFEEKDKEIIELLKKD